MKLTAFLTGSHAYGTPRSDSDVDLAVLMTTAEHYALCKALRSGPGDSDNNEGGGSSLRCGNLNLLVFTSEPKFRAWLVATKILNDRKPVSRDEAVRVIDKCERYRQVRAEPAHGFGWRSRVMLFRTLLCPICGAEMSVPVPTNAPLPEVHRLPEHVPVHNVNLCSGMVVTVTIDFDRCRLCGDKMSKHPSGLCIECFPEGVDR